MNFEQARFNMIEQQIRPWEVLDQNTLELIAKIHREDFVPEEYKQLALSDTRIPLRHDQTTMVPREEARLLQSLNLTGNEKILEIGTGCGYLTACLANAGNDVHSVDIFPEFVEDSKTLFIKLGLTNIKLYTGDGLNGWPEAGPYDVIALTGSLPEINDTIRQQLTVDGRLFAIVGKSPTMEAILVTRTGEQSWSTESLFETELPPLIGAEPVPKFKF